MPAHLLEPHERRSEIVKFRLTAAELKDLREAAKKMATDHMLHQAISVAIMDAMNLIQQMEALGYFDEEEGLLSVPGPAG